MKKYYYLNLLLFFGLSNLLAQAPYHKMLGNTNSWQICGSHWFPYVQNSARQAGSLGLAQLGQYSADRDSVVNAKAYKVFQYTDVLPFFFSPGFQMALVREDTLTQRVYMVPKDSITERVVIDFSLQVGDSIYLTFPSGNTTRLNSGYYKVDSVKTKIITIGSRKHLYLSQKAAAINSVTFKRYFLEWIESVGAVHFPINCVDNPFPFSNWFQINQWTAACGKQQYGHFVSCKTTDGTKFYHDSLSYKVSKTLTDYAHSEKSTCSYLLVNKGSGINESTAAHTIRVFPNPATDKLFITGIETADIKELSIYSTEGKKVKFASEGNDNAIKIFSENFAPGVYLLRVSTFDDREYAVKFNISY